MFTMRLQAVAYRLPSNDPRRLQHPILKGIQRFAHCDETGSLRTLVQHMLHPDCVHRATISDVLNSPFFASELIRARTMQIA